MSVSVLQEQFATGGVVLSGYRGADTPASFGDPACEFQSLLESCGLFDLSWQAKLVLTGEDRVRWLNGMVTNNVRDLALNHGNYSFVLTAQGRIAADLVAYQRGDYLLVTTDCSQLQTVKDTFEHFIIMDDVEVADISDKLSAIGIAGPNAALVLNAAAIDAAALAPGQVTDLVWNGVGISVARSTHPNWQGYELWFAADHAEVVWNALATAGAKPVGSVAIEWYRIARGVPRYGIDLSQRDLPQETEQNHALNFAKGCYIGQEIVERIRARAILHRTFTGFLLDGEPPQAGTKITEGDRNIGEITSSVRLPFPSGGRTVALGYLRRESAVPGTVVHLGERTAIVDAIPFSF